VSLIVSARDATVEVRPCTGEDGQHALRIGREQASNGQQRKQASLSQGDTGPSTAGIRHGAKG
jgi:hypothetical protein